VPSLCCLFFRLWTMCYSMQSLVVVRNSGSEKAVVFASERGEQISVTCFPVACAQVVKQQLTSGTQTAV